MLQGFSLRQRAEKTEDVDELVDILVQVRDKRSIAIQSQLITDPFFPTGNNNNNNK